MLEANPIPTIWITNDIDSVDPAIVRRFDMAMEMEVPKKKKRIEILKRYSNDLLEKKILKKLAKNPYISPAVMQRAIKVAEQTKPKNFSKTVYRLIDKTLKAQRYPGLETMKAKKKQKQQEALPKTYDPALVNVDADLEKLAEGIAKTQNARLCFYGVPGTGKSAYGRYIAKTLGREVIVKKGSDLLSMWVGGTEKNIAAAFSEAKKKKAVLIFDEVDSFLQDRQNAQRNWEVTQVNEMLTQMESFEGVFIATTNLMENLDRASLRRFDMKLEFKALEDAQVLKLLESHCRELMIAYPDEEIAKQFHLKNLTPGDFAAVVRQHRFNPIESWEDFVQRLEEEVRVKGLDEGERKMGFV
jgi:SpoVK/Ycf46/Vps4 family AAA+-type ATPase